MERLTFIAIVVTSALWLGACASALPDGSLGATVNASADEIAGCRWNDALVFLRVDRSEQLLQTDRRADGTWSEPLPARIPPAIAWRAGKPSIATLSDGRLLVIFPANRTPSNVDLAESIFDGNTWSEPRWLDAVNSPKWDSHPSLLADGSVLVFSSDRAGSKDLYLSRRTHEGWSPPERLAIAGDGDRITPTLLRDTTLLFARRTERGDFDLYRAVQSAPLQWSNAEPLPEPINSPADDLAPVVWDSLLVFSSNRSGNFDLYQFRLCGPVLLRVRVYPSATAERLDGVATVASATTIETVSIGADGAATLWLQPSEHYIVRYSNQCSRWSHQWHVPAPCDPSHTVVLDLPIALPADEPAWEATLVNVFAPGDYLPATDQHRTALALLERYNLATDGIAGRAFFDTRIVEDIAQQIESRLRCAPAATVRIAIAAAPPERTIRYTGAPLAIVGSDRSVQLMPNMLVAPPDGGLLRAYAVQQLLAQAIAAHRSAWTDRIQWQLQSDADVAPNSVRIVVERQ